MARRRKDKLSVSLFPFLSVLACVIGTLTLMITALALGQMDTDEMASAVRLNSIQRQIKALELLIEQHKDKLANADDTQKRLAETKIELRRLELQKELLIKQNEKDPSKPEVEIPVVDEEAHKKRMEQLAETLKQHQDQLKQLQAELERRGKPPEEAEVSIQPSGSGVDLDPTFVECSAAAVVIYEEEPPRRVARAVLAKDEGFLAILDRVAKQPKATVIFLVRDDGLSTYRLASSIARSHYARNGKLPVIGHGKIDLSMFKR